MSDLESPYHSDAAVEEAVAGGMHRAFVGGLWDELGQLQLDLMRRLGLQARHKLLDVGCGALRGGVHLARYLDAGHYFGQDLRAELIEAGFENEIRPAGLDDRIPRGNLVASEGFDFSGLEEEFDFALAFSVFTHLSLNSIRVCLEKIHPVLKDDGRFVATFFERPGDQPSFMAIQQPAGIVTTHGTRDPYHYCAADLEHAAAGLGFRLTFLGDIGHPRGQQAVVFEKVSRGAASPLRQLSPAEAAALPPGADHYRAYVGPPERFDIMSASQFALLFQLGLRDHHSVLDFGCGSLRLGRLLIPFLRDARYFGIDPNGWLIDEAILRELGESAVRLKRPRFDLNDRFDCSVFGETFDFVMAQSIVTHTGPELTRSLFSSVAQVLKDHGVFLFSFIDADLNASINAASPGWHYPHCVSYHATELDIILSENGLVGSPLPWFHPGASWHIAARSKDVLPSPDALLRLNGEPVR